jgi:hypothetical protein
MSRISIERRSFLRLLVAGAIGAGVNAFSCGGYGMEIIPAVRGAEFLTRHQSADGAWRSSHYGCFREGDSLTPVALHTLSRCPQSAVVVDAIKRGAAWLDSLTDRIARSGEPWAELRYPLSTASYAARFYRGRGEAVRAAVWADCIENLQLTTRLGWSENDPCFGGWSDAPRPPGRVAGAQVPDMLNPNLSATAYAVQGLAACGRRAAALIARPFVLRCQNDGAGSSCGSSVDDGGFFFVLNDPARNKAGTAGTDCTGRSRYRSYGSATCDALLALFAMGTPGDETNISSALDWLSERSAEFAHPGDWPADRAYSGRALIFYYAQGFAQVLRCAQMPWTTRARRVLRTGLALQQKPDGSWSNSDPESCEDDPLVATAFALQALQA